VTPRPKSAEPNSKPLAGASSCNARMPQMIHAVGERFDVGTASCSAASAEGDCQCVNVQIFLSDSFPLAMALRTSLRKISAAPGE